MRSLSLLPVVLASLLPGARAQQPLPPPPVPPENPITAEKAVLGKILFWDEQLSSDNSIACGTCHVPTHSGQDPRAIAPTFAAGQLIGGSPRHPGPDGQLNTADDTFGSLGVVSQDTQNNFVADFLFGMKTQATERSTPDVINSAYFSHLNWEGRARGQFTNPETGAISIVDGGALESQSLRPITSTVEMSRQGQTWPEVKAKLTAVQPLAMSTTLTPDIITALGQFPTYPDLFASAFGSPGITAERIAYAIATYERTLISNQTPYDAFLGGDPNALTVLELQGLALFRGPKFNCAACHTEPLLSDDDFHAIGHTDPAVDIGRQAETGLLSDRGKFKTPALRNMKLRNQMNHHGEEQQTLDILANYIAGGGGFTDNLDPLIVPFSTDLAEVTAIGTFLRDALTDPRVEHGLPPFDRPTLASDDPDRVPRLFGTGVEGSSGKVPEMVTGPPAPTSYAGFKLGLASALGGANAFLVLSASAPSPFGTGLAARTNRIGVAQVLPGTGLSDGFLTYHFTLPELVDLLGFRVHAQWWVQDPGAADAWARTRLVEFKPF